MKYLEVLINAPLDQSFTYAQSKDFKALVGMRVKIKFNRRETAGMVIEEHDRAPKGDFIIREIEKPLDESPLFGQKEIDLAYWMAEMYQCSPGEALSVMLPGGKKESSVPALGFDEEQDYAKRDLAPQQISALELFEKKATRDFYLYGVTGSGKTEVYLTAAERTLAQNRGVIYLVPEISLTHQLIREAAVRFRGKIAVIHSGITPSQKLREWRRIKNGEAPFVIGARSAVFAPLTDPGLFIIDEEHEGSYKSASNPRYHARQVAMKRASANNARCILGSATPSMEAHYSIQSGNMSCAYMNERLAGGQQPQVKVIDMNKEKRCLSKALVSEIKNTLAQKRQVILFLNRRGFTYFFHCRSCGWEMTCKQCSVSLTYHKELDKMICHYCGFNQRPLKVCPECGSLDVGYSGYGTEMIEQEINETFPEYKQVRLDADAVKRKGSLQKVLNDFRIGKYDILLGTQMVAKGLNFPNVKLVGIVNADMGLQLPDFRAQERVFSLILQVSGRAGRFFPDGKVLVQTFRPDNDAVRLASMRDSETFYKKELEIRKMLSFPPFVRMTRLVLRGKDQKTVEKEARTLAGFILSLKSVSVLGPGECPIAVIAGNYRYQLLLRDASLRKILETVKYARKKLKINKNVYLEIDVDPLSLL